MSQSSLAKKRSVNLRFVAVVAAVFLLLFALSYLFPYSGDDWAWGSEIGLKRLQTGFVDYNGRYAGNLLVMALTRVRLLRAAVMAVVYTATALLARNFASSKKTVVFLFGVALFFLLPKRIFVQAVVWTSGFTNYVPSILLVFCYFCLIKNIFEKEKPVYPRFLFVLTAVIGFVSALFMETVTLCSLGFAGLVILYVLIRFKRVYLCHGAYLVGSVAGAVVMFTNSAYGLVMENKDTYRSTAATAEGGMRNVVTSHCETIFEQLFADNLPLLVILSTLLVLLVMFTAAKRKKGNGLIGLCVFANAVSLLVMLFKSAFPYWMIGLESSHKNTLTLLFFVGTAAVWFASLALGTLLTIAEKAKAALLLLGVPLLVAPHVVVSPIGPRCFFPAYFLMSALAVLLLQEILLLKKPKPFATRTLVVAFAGMIAASALFYFSIYLPIYRCSEARNRSAVEQAKTSSVVTLTKLPYPSYVHYGDPKKAPWNTRYKLFYGLDEDVTFTFADPYSDTKQAAPSGD